jgi:DNA-binding transcriptional MerR regulator
MQQDPQAAADALGISVSTLDYWRQKGVITSTVDKNGMRWYKITSVLRGNDTDAFPYHSS